MKTLSKLLVTVGVILQVQSAFACDSCNKAYYEELMNKRPNSIAATEVLAAMKAQGNVPYWVDSSKTATNDITLKDAAATAPQKEFIEIINRDKKLPIPETGYVPQDTKPNKSFSIELEEGEAYIGKGVFFKGFTTNKKIPGPMIVVDEGDVVEFNIVNKGNIPHGASIHAAYTQTSKYLGKIGPGETKKMVFRATYPGVYMYHCAPGGHAIPMHVIFGQYGMMVVRPKEKYKLEQILKKKPDAEIFLLQHELYSNGKDAIEGKPLYTMFNGKLFRYVEEPVKVKPGDYVRINFLNVGPNLLSTFHIVGIIWDFAYWQGNPKAVFPGGQTVTAGPSDSWVVEFRAPPDEGAYLMLSHAVGSTDRGAIGLLMVDKDAKTPITVGAEGPTYTDEEFKDLKSKAVRTFSPFEPSSPDVDVPVRYNSTDDAPIVRIMGNSFNPKVIKVKKGTTVKWVNEEVFTYMESEFSGLHNIVMMSGPETFASPLIAHAESYSHTFTKEGEYDYICAPHSYMKAKVIVE